MYDVLFKVSVKLCLLFLILLSALPVIAAQSSPTVMREEPLIKAVVEAGPVTIGCRYRSMEGPEFIRDTTIENLVTSGRLVLPESSVRLIRTSQSHVATPGVPGIDRTSANRTGTDQATIDKTTLYLIEEAQVVGPAVLLLQHPANWINAACQQQLYWFRGAKLEVIDEHGNVVPGAEFLCHAGIEVNRRLHKLFFPRSSRCYDDRIFTFTQGITDMMLPEGFGVPLAANEEARFVFKALNRTTDRPRRIKLRCTIYLAADNKLMQPITALKWYRTGVSVIVGGCTAHGAGHIAHGAGNTAHSGAGNGSSCTSMCCMSTAEEAPNDIVHWVFKRPLYKNRAGQELTGHWVVLPGRHIYPMVITDRNFNKNGAIHAVVSHVHPFCEKLSLIEIKPNCLTKVLFTVHCATNNSQGIKILHVDYLTWPGAGLVLDKNAKYGLEVSYNNTSGINQDSMAVIILFFSDPKFKKPLWAAA